MLPFGAPGDIPPCIRQRPFGIAADRHGLPLLVRAPHRGLWCMGAALFVLFSFYVSPPPPASVITPRTVWPVIATVWPVIAIVWVRVGSIGVWSIIGIAPVS